MISHKAMRGMKAFLTDGDTKRTVSSALTLSDVMMQDVYYVEELKDDSPEESMQHLIAVVFLRPIDSSIALLQAELRRPRFREYHVFFSNSLPREVLQDIADADEHDLVRQVQEYFADFVAINEDLFALNFPRPIRSSNATRAVSRGADGILAALLAFRAEPMEIRYTASSPASQLLASEVQKRIENDSLHHFARENGPVLLILDRLDDPVTPLLSQWTYQAMVHELLELEDNSRITLKGRPGVKSGLEEITLCASQDPFFAQHRFDTFGELGNAVKYVLMC